MNPDFVPAEPFAIGLKPLEVEHLLQIDDDFLPYRQQKSALYATMHDLVCMAESETVNAQIEVIDLLRQNLIDFHSTRYKFDGETAHCLETGRSFNDNITMPLASISLLIPEDLVLMRRDDSGWRLVAASMSFPSSWNLQEKFSRPLEMVHGPVPMPEKMSQRINRIFDGLQPSIPVWRSNWSFSDDDQLRHDRPEFHSRRKQKRLAGNIFLRTEFQTLHKLPISGDILFTIRIKVAPISNLQNDENGKRALAKLHQQYLDMSDAERDYKGINRNADGLLTWLGKFGQQKDE